MRTKILVLLGLLLGVSLAPAAGVPGRIGAPGEADHFVILVYHHVSEDTPSSTSITPQRFAEHLQFIQDNDYRVWHVARAMRLLHAGAELPDRVVAITFDDAYESVYENAWPMLHAKRMPFAVMVNTESIDAGHEPYMSWEQLRTLARRGVIIGNHGAAHSHLPRLASDQSDDDWIAAVSDELGRAQNRLRANLPNSANLFAWPYGEDAPELYDDVLEVAEFGLVQRSGAVSRDTPLAALPRFPMATGQDSLERLEMALRARAMPVTAADTVPPRKRAAVIDPERLELTLGESDDFDFAAVSCFRSNGDSLPVEPDPARDGILVVDVSGIGRSGRNKVNCTSPATDGSGDHYWFSFQWLQPGPDGEWPDE